MIQETEEEPVGTFKLKANHNYDLKRYFQRSVGRPFDQKDDLAFDMIGNIEDMIDKVNEASLRYTGGQLSNSKTTISVKPLGKEDDDD